MKKVLAAGLLSCATAAFAGAASAVEYGGVEFPQGAISFADAVVSYAPGVVASGPTAGNQGAFNALGAPDYTGAPCALAADCQSVSLGVGGSIVLQFTNNVLTGSDSNAFDLWVFEVGPDVEDTTVELSVDGMTWSSVGAVGGSTAGIDIDAFGFGSGSAFSFVRLTDVANEGDVVGASVGADIDALGAISTRAVGGIPEPQTWALMLLGFGGLGAAIRRTRRLATA